MLYLHQLESAFEYLIHTFVCATDLEAVIVLIDVSKEL